MTTEPHWDNFEDARGAGVVGVGATLAGAFGEAGRAITALVTDLADVTPRDDIEIKVRGGTQEELLSGWLEAVIREMDRRQMLFADFEVYVGEDEVVGVGQHLCFAVVDHQAVDALEQRHQIAMRGLDPKLHGVGYRQAATGNLVKRLELRGRRRVCQKHIIGSAVRFG